MIYIFIRKIHLSFIITLVLSFTFLSLQGYEYYWGSFYITDGVLGSVFYMLTGLHGLHVIIGTILILISYFKIIETFKNNKGNDASLGYQNLPRIFLYATIWYWHFVDAVWILLFISVYIPLK